jgi:GNAT superfamily N-acetyltransferase
MTISVRQVELPEIASLRDAFRAEMNCQIVHDSIHVRPGWTREFLLADGDSAIGYGSVAVAGPWQNRPTVYEFYVMPEQRSRAFPLFDAFLAESLPQAFEVLTSDTLSTTMCLTFARDIGTERIVFRDHVTTTHTVTGATLKRVTSVEEIRTAIAERQGGGEWVVESDGVVVARGGLLFHYNIPYADVYMDVDESSRRRGIGSYLVQELKRACYEMGAIPCARCSTSNGASRRTLQKAGFTPFAHILFGSIDSSADAIAAQSPASRASDSSHTPAAAESRT